MVPVWEGDSFQLLPSKTGTIYILPTVQKSQVQRIGNIEFDKSFICIF